MNDMKTAKFAIGQVVRHRLFPFRGVIFDVDPQFSNTDEWYDAIPREVRPRKDQPFYHLLAENSETEYIAYVSEQNLLEDDSGEPVRHPQLARTVRAQAGRPLCAKGAGAALTALRACATKKRGKCPAFQTARSRLRSVGGLGLVLLFLELLGEVLVVLGDEFLKLLLAVLDVGLLQRRAVESAGEACQRNLDRVGLVLRS